jgi:hypothetical protein
MSLRRARSVCTPQTHSEPGTIAPAPDPLNGAGAIGEGADSVPKPSAHNPPVDPRLGPHGVGVVVLGNHGAGTRRGVTGLPLPDRRQPSDWPWGLRAVGCDEANHEGRTGGVTTTNLEGWMSKSTGTE